MLCPMCGAPTDNTDRWTQVAHRVSAKALRRNRGVIGLPPSITDDRTVIDAGAIAPLHKACVDRSLRYCPHLKADPNIDVRPFPDEWVVLPLWVQAQAAAQTFLAQPGVSRTIQAIGFLQLIGLP